jgi:hypothetical protein
VVHRTRPPLSLSSVSLKTERLTRFAKAIANGWHGYSLQLNSNGIALGGERRKVKWIFHIGEFLAPVEFDETAPAVLNAAIRIAAAPTVRRSQKDGKYSIPMASFLLY